MTDLNALLGGFYSRAYAINNAGQVTGFSSKTISGHSVTVAYVYSNGVATDLGNLGSQGENGSQGYAINNADRLWVNPGHMRFFIAMAQWWT